MTEGAAKTATKTEYVVLEQITVPAVDGEDVHVPAYTAWVESGTTETATKNDAIKAVAGEREGVFKGVPLRSWKGAIKTAPSVVIKTEELDI